MFFSFSFQSLSSQSIPVNLKKIFFKSENKGKNFTIIIIVVIVVIIIIVIIILFTFFDCFWLYQFVFLPLNSALVAGYQFVFFKYGQDRICIRIMKKGYSRRTPLSSWRLKSALKHLPPVDAVLKKFPPTKLDYFAIWFKCKLLY